MGKPSCAKATVAVPGPQPISRILEEEECFAALTAMPTSWLTRIQILGELIDWRLKRRQAVLVQCKAHRELLGDELPTHLP